MDFLPSDYKAPTASSDGYLKIKKDTENRIRIMSKPILGWEDWTADKRPIRFRMESKPASPILPENKIRHFWAFVVYNYNENKIQIMHIVQASIQKQIQALVTNSDWGSPYTYDIKISRKGEGMETDYQVFPCPHKPIDKDVLEMFYNKPIYLEALFTNEDPFGMHPTYTKCECGISAGKEEKPQLSAHINAAQITALQEIFEFDVAVEKEVMDLLSKQGIRKLSDIPSLMYDKVVKRANEIRKVAEEKEKQAIEFPF